MSYGCTKQEGRVTYPSSMQWTVESNRITCGDYRSKKMYEYLLQTERKIQTDRMIREGEGGEIENGKVSKAKRKMTLHKSKYAKKKSEQEIVKVDKPKRMIRLRVNPDLEDLMK